MSQAKGTMTMPMTTISVPEIHCDHCKTSIEGALLPVPGVTAAEVDIAARNVTVTYDEAVVDQATLVWIIEEQGYQVPTP
jgi:copper chaperone